MSCDEIEFSLRADRSTIQSGSGDTTVNCAVDIHLPVGPAREGGSSPTRTSLCLAIDCSFSMAGAPIRAAAESARSIVDGAQEGMAISLVAFESRSHVLASDVAATTVGKRLLHEQLNCLSEFVRGSTNTADGIRRGIEAVRRSTADAKVMIVLSDGVADKPERAELAAIAAAEEGIQLFAIGLGAAFGASHLNRLVAPSNGVVLEQRDVHRLAETFEQLRTRIDNFVATHCALQLCLHEGASLRGLAKQAPERAEMATPALDAKHSATLKLGNLERGTQYVFALSIEAPARGKGMLELLSATLRYDLPHSGQYGCTATAAIEVEYVAQSAASKPARPEPPAPAPKASEAAPPPRPVSAKPERPVSAKPERMYEVVVTDAGRNRLVVVREARDATHVALWRLRRLAYSGQGVVQRGADLAAARALKKRLQAVGARALVRRLD